jgi:hypothetical protein
MSNGKKKTLLQENTIRRFMKLANMEALQENYFDHYGLEEQEEEEMEMEDEVEMGDEGDEMEFGAEEEVEMGDEELGDEGGDVDEAAIRDLVDTIATAIEDKYDIPMSVEGGEEEVEMGAEEEEVGLGGEEEVEMGGEEEEVEMGGEEELMELLDDAGIEIVDNEPIVQEVLKRVAKRLIREKMNVSK